MNFAKIAGSICGADTRENIQNINILYDKYKDTPNEYILYNTRTLLMYMCQYSKYFYDKIEILLKNGANPDLLTNKQLNCFSFAAEGLINNTGDERIISLLHEYKCDYPNIKNEYDNDNEYNINNTSMTELFSMVQILSVENKINHKKISELEKSNNDLTAVVNALVEKVREIDFRPPHCGNAEYEAANSRFDAAKTDLESQKN